MNVSLCDRCRFEMEQTSEPRDGRTHLQWTKFVVFSREIDLCPNCTGAMERFMRNEPVEPTGSNIR